MRLTIPILPIANPKVMESYSHITPTNRNSIMRNRQSCRSPSTQRLLSTTNMQPQALSLGRLPKRSFTAFRRPFCSRHNNITTIRIPIPKCSHDTWQLSIPRQPSKCPLRSTSTSSAVRSGLMRRPNQTIPEDEVSGRISRVSPLKDRQKLPKRPRCCSRHSPSKRRAMALTRKPRWRYLNINNNNNNIIIIIITTAYPLKR